MHLVVENFLLIPHARLVAEAAREPTPGGGRSDTAANRTAATPGAGAPGAGAAPSDGAGSRTAGAAGPSAAGGSDSP